MKEILIVEDELMVQQLYRDILQIKGYKVVGAASTGEEALDILRSLERWPDLIILDHRMPGMGGIEAARIMLRDNPGARIIIVSADENAVWGALKMGIVGMRKPFNITDLIDAIEKATPTEVDGIPAAPLKAAPLEIQEGGMYLVMEKEGVRGLDQFVGLLANGYDGLAFTRKHPDVIKRVPGLSEVPVVWMTPTPVKEIPSITPQEAQRMLILVQSIIGRSRRSAIYVWGFEHLLKGLGLDRGLDLIRALKEQVMLHKETVLLFSMDLGLLDDVERPLIRKEFTVLN